MSPDLVPTILQELQPKDAPVLTLFTIYRAPKYLPLWKQDVRLYQHFGQRLIRLGNPGPALELVREGLLEGYHPGDADLLYLEALALSRGGNVSLTAERLTALLGRVDLSAFLRSETLSLRGRTLKDRYEHAVTDAERIDFARQSADAYEEAFGILGDPFPGVNAATLSLLAGDAPRSAELARRALEKTRPLLAASEDDYWLHASLGEAQLLLGEVEAAKESYRRAVELAGKDYGSIASMRHQLELQKRLLPAAADLFDRLQVGAVVAFAGHRIDPPDARPARFPPELEEAVRQALRQKLQDLNAVVGYCSPGSGSDLLFAEVMVERGAELNLVLPFDLQDFFLHRVDHNAPERRGWRDRCQKVLEAAKQKDAVHHATREEFLDEPGLFDFANTFLQGLALTRARQVGGTARALVVIDSQDEAASGTMLFRSRWRNATGTDPWEIRLDELRKRAGLPTPPLAETAETVPARPHRRQVRAMLFADVKNCSKLPERYTPDFYLAFLHQVHRILDGGKVEPCYKNTSGDGLFVVMDRARDCADFALRLLGEMETFDWKRLGLLEETGVRVGLHTGPVFPAHDPIIDRENYFGSHVNRAARIEPVTVPGSAFVSEQFAAILAMEAPAEFVCEPLGVHRLPKEFDRCRMYRLRRRSGALPRPARLRHAAPPPA